MSLRAPAHRAGSDEPRALPAERRPPARRLRARIRTLIASCLLALVLAAGSFEIARMVLMRSFAEMDADATRQGAERARRALEADLATLEAAAERGAEWDEMYEALSPRPDPRRIAAKFSAQLLESISVDLIWIRDAAGRTVYAAKLEPRVPGRLAELAPGELARLTREASRIDAASDSSSSSLARLLAMPRGALAFAVSPVLRTDRSGPPALQGRVSCRSRSRSRADPMRCVCPRRSGVGSPPRRRPPRRSCACPTVRC